MAGGLFTCISVRGHGGRAPPAGRLWLTHLPITALPGANRWSLHLDPFPPLFPGPLPAWALLRNYILILPASQIRDSLEGQTIIDEHGNVFTVPALIPHRPTCCVGPNSISWPLSSVLQQKQAQERGARGEDTVHFVY